MAITNIGMRSHFASCILAVCHCYLLQHTATVHCTSYFYSTQCISMPLLSVLSRWYLLPLLFQLPSFHPPSVVVFLYIHLHLWVPPLLGQLRWAPYGLSLYTSVTPIPSQSAAQSTVIDYLFLLTSRAPRPAATDARLSADPSPFAARLFTIVSMLVVVPALIRCGQPAS